MLETPITPGLLCREYLCEACPRLDVGILIATRDLKKKKMDEIKGSLAMPVFVHTSERP